MRCRDLLALHPSLKETSGYGYAAKPLAIAASSFEEVLLLDADNTVCRDPAFLFDCEPYATTGALFWRDMYRFGEKFVRMYDPWGVRRRPTRLDALLQDALEAVLVSPVRCTPDFTPTLAALGMGRADATFESGQLLMHKSRCRRGLAAAMVLNFNSHRDVVYAGLHGDKDTFALAFRAVGAPFSAMGARPDLGGHVSAGLFHDTAFVQRAPPPDGRPTFVHFCGRHRGDARSRTPSARMLADGRPFRNWPEDDRRGYTRGELVPWAAEHGVGTFER